MVEEPVSVTLFWPYTYCLRTRFPLPLSSTFHDRFLCTLLTRSSPPAGENTGNAGGTEKKTRFIAIDN